MSPLPGLNIGCGIAYPQLALWATDTPPAFAGCLSRQFKDVLLHLQELFVDNVLASKWIELHLREIGTKNFFVSSRRSRRHTSSPQRKLWVKGGWKPEPAKAGDIDTKHTFPLP
jgi:hypothetical protein